MNIIPTYTVETARCSNLAGFDFKIIFVYLDNIGIHESIDAEKLSNVLNSMKSIGYKGPAISVFERGSDNLYKTVSQDELLKKVKYGDIGIADGHNRLAAFKILKSEGIYKYSYIPVQLIPARSPVIEVRTTSSNERPLTVEEIESTFPEPEMIIPFGTSHFETKLSNGEWVRVRESQPDIVFSF